jgi:mannose-6-phosphate isomerase-like protein (cupin superfamily)
MPFEKPAETFFRAQRLDKPWGHELLWAWGAGYVGKILHVRAGEALSLQFHELKDETLSVLSGRIRLEHGPGPEALASRELAPGDCVRILPGMVHRIVALEDADVLEASTTELGDVVRLEDRYGRAP